MSAPLANVARPNCKLGFDAWSPALRGEDLHAAARKTAPYPAITTDADYVSVPRYRYQPALMNYEQQSPDWVRAIPFGTGCIDSAAFLPGCAKAVSLASRLTRCALRRGTAVRWKISRRVPPRLSHGCARRIFRLDLRRWTC